ncbi:uncharacterized protein LOC6537142 [Drosophila yakuba]|uniref:Uncharacterized protein n=1 Tax=Drosophila yakuba TaxID=7245 RepID=B4PRL5_DROYA|nr:uncharacterized protein LOC6537142 [Drosophila yakuba]EDW97415.1 uncharacterized protein Dyak_GE26361 [Drosophila yakuba]
MCEIKPNFVTHDLVHNLKCSKRGPRIRPDMKKTRAWPGARFMCVCKEGDLNTAAYCLAELMHEPFRPFPMATVAVHHSIRDEFIERVRSRFRQLKPHVANHPNFIRAVQELKYGLRPVKYVLADVADAPACASPILVTEGVTHLFFPSGPSGCTTLHSFSTMSEVALIFGKETPNFDAVYFFDETITRVYILAKLISCVQFFVNCMDACLLEIMPHYMEHTPMVIYKRGYHYETLELGQQWKIIVFPYSTSILRQCCCPTGQCRCYATHSACCEDHLQG